MWCKKRRMKPVHVKKRCEPWGWMAKEKTKNLQIKVSTREYPYQKNRISYISWLTYYTKCRKIHKQKQQQKKKLRIPNTQTSLTLERKKAARREEKNEKPLPMLQKWKTIEPFQKKKTTFRKLSISPLWIRHTDTNKKCLLKLWKACQARIY